MDQLSKSTGAPQKPPREYPDWQRLVPGRFRKEVYAGSDNWVHYYNMDWEDLLVFGVILHNKDYLIEGGMPEWFRVYAEDCVVEPFDHGNGDVVISFHKAGWIRNTLVFQLEDSTIEDGFVYNVKSILQPDPEFLAGNPAPGRAACPQSVWQRCVIAHMERLRYGNDWNPTKKG